MLLFCGYLVNSHETCIHTYTYIMMRVFSCHRNQFICDDWIAKLCRPALAHPELRDVAEEVLFGLSYRGGWNSIIKTAVYYYMHTLCRIYTIIMMNNCFSFNFP